jgi:AcrR family transcriptional regulator
MTAMVGASVPGALSDITRERILRAVERLFADRGYEETSIRAIVAKARVNQAAINYHFGGKDGLYREFADGFFAPSPSNGEHCRGGTRRRGGGSPA